MVTEARQTTLDELIETTTPLPENKERHKDSWGEVVFYSDGWAWGISPTGATICLGREAAVRAAVANLMLRCRNETVNKIVELERKLQEDIKNQNGRNQGINAKYAARKPIIGNYKRVRSGRLVGVKQRNNRRPAARTKPAVQSVKPK